ncbi:hypothetical protein [Flavobacterium sp. 25HG05S-40]|uniref:hypothetical protein n=1 Tax=Flavobacterium sp. 25HG05S-40 TaxID=3458682 RepID=UPI0040448D55
MRLTFERKLLIDELCKLKEFKSTWVEEMSKQHRIALATVYHFKNLMIDAKILKPPTDFTFNTNQEEINAALEREPFNYFQDLNRRNCKETETAG